MLMTAGPATVNAVMDVVEMPLMNMYVYAARGPQSSSKSLLFKFQHPYRTTVKHVMTMNGTVNIAHSVNYQTVKS